MHRGVVSEQEVAIEGTVDQVRAHSCAYHVSCCMLIAPCRWKEVRQRVGGHDTPRDYGQDQGDV